MFLMIIKNGCGVTPKITQRRVWGGGGVFRDLVLHKVLGEVREILTCMSKQILHVIGRYKSSQMRNAN